MNPINPFILIFPQPFEGGSVCPLLQHLELSRAVLARDSVAALRRALMERNARGTRLKRIRLSDDVTEVGDLLILESFLDLVDEVG